MHALGEEKKWPPANRHRQRLFGSSPNSDSNFTRISSSSDQDNMRAIATIAGTTYIGTYGYGVEKVQGSQHTRLAEGKCRQREITSLGKDANERLLIGAASTGIFFDGKQTIVTTL